MYDHHLTRSAMLTSEDLRLFGTVFPPRNHLDVGMYDDAEVRDRYLDGMPEEPPPGCNRSPGYRRGWVKAVYDADYGADDGFAHIRRQVFAAIKAVYEQAAPQRRAC